MKKGNQGDGGGRPLIEFTDTQVAQVEALAAVLSKNKLPIIWVSQRQPSERSKVVKKK